MTNSLTDRTPVRPIGLSAFVRCKNEEEYIVASLLSAYRVFDEIVVALNNSTDRTQELIEDLIPDHPKIKLVFYNHECSPSGHGYIEKVKANPSSGLAQYYNWCMEQTSFSHVCKWDGDMIATPVFEKVRDFIGAYDMVIFDGYDVLGEITTNNEPRIFRYDASRARYLDWDLYEILDHDYSSSYLFAEKCYLHMKLVKKDWLHRKWVNPNDSAVRSVPPSRAEQRPLGVVRVIAGKVKRRLQGH